jgi:hypothetical protein
MELFHSLWAWILTPVGLLVTAIAYLNWPWHR